MSFIEQKDSTIRLTQIFNEEHASMILQQKVSETPNFDSIELHNVGIKIMKDAFEKFAEHPVRRVAIYYDWNEIMMMPKLVCYDKNTWKTLQQLANWNREWSLFLRPCLALTTLEANISCTWADDHFVKAFLQGVASLPNVQNVNITVKSKNEKVAEMLQAFKEAKIFPHFTCQFVKAN